MKKTDVRFPISEMLPRVPLKKYLMRTVKYRPQVSMFELHSCVSLTTGEWGRWTRAVFLFCEFGKRWHFFLVYHPRTLARINYLPIFIPQTFGLRVKYKICLSGAYPPHTPSLHWKRESWKASLFLVSLPILIFIVHHLFVFFFPIFLASKWNKVFQWSPYNSSQVKSVFLGRI